MTTLPRYLRAILVGFGPMVVLAICSWMVFGRASAPAQAATITVDVGNDWFCDSSYENGICVTNINAGDTVEWSWTTTNVSHTTTEDSDVPIWDSHTHRGPFTFDHTFDTPGTFSYRCTVHPGSMRGQIVVSEGIATETPGVTVLPTAMPTDTPAATALPSATIPSAATATPSAHATMTATPTRTATPPATGGTGDVNCSGAADSIDAALVLQFDAALVHSLSCQQNGDTNQDGSINSLDGALILQYSAGLLGHLPTI